MLELITTDLTADYRGFRRRTVRGVAFARLRFAIMHGNGNVILVLDEQLSGLSAQQVDGVLAREICQSYTAVRVDGIAFVRTSCDQVRMTYFEWDGTHSTMCGNALRCVTRYCAERGYLANSPAGTEDVILTDDGPKWVSAVGGRIRVELGPGREFRRVRDEQYFAFSGLAHLVLLTGDLAGVDVPAVARPLRYDEGLCAQLAHPEGLHVNFMQRHGDGIAVRTYEVGVEDETLACGTGVAASAFVAHQVWGLPFPMRVRVRGGEMTVHHNERGLLISGTTNYLFSNVAPGRPTTRSA
jgi:diaminopimelate epimerase